MRTFETGATRDTASNKPDYEGFLSPEVLVEYGAYMLRHQRQSDGNLRDSDNWQKGMPPAVYIKSLFRHFVDLWRIHRGARVIDPKTDRPVTVEEACCAILFNVQGYLHEFLKNKGRGAFNVGEELEKLMREKRDRSHRETVEKIGGLCGCRADGSECNRDLCEPKETYPHGAGNVEGHRTHKVIEKDGHLEAVPLECAVTRDLNPE